MPGMSQATAAQLPVLLHPPAFMPPGMLGALWGWQTTARGRGASGGDSLPGVTVTGKDCDKVITLSVYLIVPARSAGPLISPLKKKTLEKEQKGREARAKQLMDRAKQLLSRMGPWDCCPSGSHKCLVKLALDIVDVPAPGAKKGVAVAARFYHNERERKRNMSGGNTPPAGAEGDPFGLWRPDGSGLEIPSITEWAMEHEGQRGDEGAFRGGTPTPSALEYGDSSGVIASNSKVQLVFAYDILATIIHEALHAMGATHAGTDNLMSKVWNIGVAGAFNIPTGTACQIATRNGVCIGAEREKCCMAKGGAAGNHGKRGFPAMTHGFTVPGMSVAGMAGGAGGVGIAAQWKPPPLQEGRGFGYPSR